MGYMHIDNLYKDQRILAFPKCYALEKVHGTSAHVGWNGKVYLFSGGASQGAFASLFDADALAAAMAALGQAKVVVYGEAYGGKMQRMSATYGPGLRFVAFDVLVGDRWLNVPEAQAVVSGLGIEFVPWSEIDVTLPAIDAERDRSSEIAIRRGCGTDKMREGVVLRPIIEAVDFRGNRIIVKHKRDEFRETSEPRRVVDPAQLSAVADANAIAAEWVTEMRLTHVLDAFGQVNGMEQTGAIINAMIADVEREAAGEIVVSKDARHAIGKRTAQMLKARLVAKLVSAN